MKKTAASMTLQFPKNFLCIKEESIHSLKNIDFMPIG